MSAPQAQVIAMHGRVATILCPFCGNKHRHTVLMLGQSERFAPGCGLYLSGEKRAGGYRFHTRGGQTNDRH